MGRQTKATVVDPKFLDSYKQLTESVWQTRVPHDFHVHGEAGLDWQTGTRWRGGMTAAEITAAESRFGIQFPADYRLFLETLHTPDPPLVGAAWEGNQLVKVSGRVMPDWTGDPEVIDRLLERPIVALAEATYKKQLYQSMSRADWFAAQRRLLAGGPAYIPVIRNWYLLSTGGLAGMPLIRVDELGVTIPDSSSLRQCLVNELFRPSKTDPQTA